jgi:SAM-dependent methyltransferase
MDKARAGQAASFGIDPAGYDQGRPVYPAQVFDLLQTRCGLGPSTAGFEIGPGTGLATRILLDRGIGSLTAIEPDARLAAFLAESEAGADQRLRIVNTTFAAAELREAAFDLGVAATTMHWLEPAPALERCCRLLRPGGWWAMWWNLFGDAVGVDAFHEASLPLLSRVPANSTASTSSEFALDADARLAELAAAGFVAGQFELIRWSAPFDAAKTRALYATFPHIRLLPSAEQAALLDELGRIVTDQFGGVVDRTLLTPVYTARRP